MGATNFKLEKVYPGDVRRSRDIGRVVEWMESLPYDKAWKISGEEAKSERTQRANSYYWAVVVEAISQHTGYEGEEVHEFCCGIRWGWVDKKCPKTPRNPDGIESVPRRTTTTDEAGRRSVLKVIEFMDFVEFVRRFAAIKLGLNTPDPDPDWKLHQGDDEQERAA